MCAAGVRVSVREVGLPLSSGFARLLAALRSALFRARRMSFAPEGNAGVLTKFAQRLVHSSGFAVIEIVVHDHRCDDANENQHPHQNF